MGHYICDVTTISTQGSVTGVVSSENNTIAIEDGDCIIERQKRQASSQMTPIFFRSSSAKFWSSSVDPPTDD